MVGFRKLFVPVSEIYRNFSIIDVKNCVILNVPLYFVIIPEKFFSSWLHFYTDHKMHENEDSV